MIKTKVLASAVPTMNTDTTTTAGDADDPWVRVRLRRTHPTSKAWPSIPTADLH